MTYVKAVYSGNKVLNALREDRVSPKYGSAGRVDGVFDQGAVQSVRG